MKTTGKGTAMLETKTGRAPASDADGSHRKPGSNFAGSGRVFLPSRALIFLFFLAFLVAPTSLATIFPGFLPSAALAQNERAGLTVYTALGATTAQLPLLGALEMGWPEGREVKVEYWKTLEDLRVMALAGKGEVWVGHMETLARAAARGAPVSLLAVTAWRKFYFVCPPLPDGDGGEAWPETVAGLLELASKNNLTVTSAPQNSPAGEFLARLNNLDPPFPTEALPPQQLALELIRERRLIGLLPEPLATSAVLKNPRLKIIGSLEEEYGRVTGGPGMLPQAGVAVNINFFQDDPESPKKLLALMTAAVEDFGGDPGKMLGTLPAEARETLGDDVILASLAVEPMIIRSAESSEQEILDYLAVAVADLFESGRRLPETFIWKEPEGR
jgi:NitT/TauT family transport system substrate-binding protein